MREVKGKGGDTHPSPRRSLDRGARGPGQARGVLIAPQIEARPSGLRLPRRAREEAMRAARRCGARVGVGGGLSESPPARRRPKRRAGGDGARALEAFEAGP